ncbi:MAG: sulfotransferase [Solirubrobacterales bacterium]
MTDLWPNLFIVGAAKAGTTSLHAYLGDHPDIFMSAVKEPHYFSRLQPSERRRAFLPTVDDEKDYLALFRAGGDKPVRGESSTSYLTVPEAAGRIRRACPDSKAVIALRDPVERAYSHFLADTRDGIEDRGFREALEDELSGREEGGWGAAHLYVRTGLYAEPVRRYQETFGEDLMVVFFERLKEDPIAVVEDVLAFLNVSTSHARSLSPEAHNPHRVPRSRLARRVFTSGVVRRLSRRILPRDLRARAKDSLTRTSPKPGLSDSDREFLLEVFREDVGRLPALLGSVPPWPAFA